LNYRSLLLGFPALCAVHCTDTAATDNPSQTGLETGVKEAGPDATESHGNSNETSIPALTSTGAPHNNQVEGGPPDTPPLGERDAGDGATPTSLGDGGIHVGDRIDGEEVVHVYDYGNDCVEVTLRAAPRFACTAQQLATLDAALIEPSEPEYGADTPDLAVSTCGDLASLRRSALTQSLNARLERSYVSRLNAYCAPQSHYAHFDSDGQVSTCAQFVDAGAPASPDPNGSETASEYSTTNTQVEDVDEADWVKNDGGTIYVLNDSQLLVFDAWPVEEMTELARVELRSEPRRMFLDGERLVVYLREGVTDAEENCTYGYDCRSASEGGSTAVQVYDVSEPASPLLLKEYQFSGAYLASRRIGSSVYSVLHDQGAPEPVDADLKLSANDPDALDAEFEPVSASLKVPFWKTFWRVTLPICTPALIDISRYFFINAMTTISAVVFLYSPETRLVSVTILNLDEAGEPGAAAAMAVLIAMTSLSVCILYLGIGRLAERHTQRWRKPS